MSIDEKVVARREKTMKKLGITSAIATGFAAALFGLAAPANADITHQHNPDLGVGRVQHDV